MPIVYQQDINPYTKLAVWHIIEHESFFEASVAAAREITNHKKRLQHLAGRYLLKQLFPNFPTELIRVAKTRKPFIQSDPFHFSISHCGDYAAAIVSTQQKVGIDVEIPVAKINAIRDKFLSPTEQAIIDNRNVELLTASWSLKEAFFKWYGKGGVDFKKDMVIKKLEAIEDEVFATVHFGKEINEELAAYGKKLGNCFVIWVVS